MRSRSAAGVSPVLTQVRISTSEPAQTELLSDARQRRLEVAMNVVRQRFERRNVDHLCRVWESALEPLPHQIVDRGKKGRKRLARSMGAAMSVWRPALIAGQASACAGVGAAKLSANQFATAGWNRVSAPVDA